MGGLGVEGGTNLFLSLYSSFSVLSISLASQETTKTESLGSNQKVSM